MKLRVAASSALAGALIDGSFGDSWERGGRISGHQLERLRHRCRGLDARPDPGYRDNPGFVGGRRLRGFPLSSPATLFASTGGGHITAGFKLDTSITAADVTVTTPAPPTFMFATPVNGVPGPSGGFGNFTAGLQGSWNGTSNIFAGPIDFTIAA